MDRLVAVAQEMQAAAKLHLDGVGIAVAGFVDDRREVMTDNPNIRWLEGFPLKEQCQTRFGLATFLDVDSNAAALAEYLFGAGSGTHRMLFLCIGTGLGGAVVIDGELLRFAHQGIGDPGHVLIQSGGLQCTAGCRGCAEGLISTSGIERRFRELLGNADAPILAYPPQHASAREIIEKGRLGDALAVRVLQETGRWLGITVGSLAAVFCPERIVVGGGIAEAGNLLLDSTEFTFRSMTGTMYHANVEIRKACLGWRAGLVGAASAVWSGKVSD
jgi:glucokinase